MAVGDAHCPFQSSSAIRWAAALGRRLKPRNLVFLGDEGDCLAWNSFPKVEDQTIAGRWDAERKAILKYYSAFSEVGDRTYTLAGNHGMDRIRRVLGSSPHTLPYLPDPYKILAVDSDIQYIDTGILTLRNSSHTIIIAHGWKTRAEAGAAAWCMAKKAQIPFLQGHTHRAGLRQVGPLWGMEAGWLGDIHSPAFSFCRDIAAGTCDWRHAAAVVWDDGTPQLILR